MGKISCFCFLLAGGNKTKRSKVRGKVAYAKKATGNDCPKVKPVEFMDMADTVDLSNNLAKSCADAPACDTNAFVPPTHTATESPRQERDRDDNEGKASSDSSGYTSGNNAVSPGEPDAGGSSGSAANVSPVASPKLKRSCSNIETARSVPAEEFDDVPPAKSRSYGDLIKALPSGRALTTTPSGGAASSPASVRSSRSADCVMLRKQSSRQVLPSRSRKLWWRLLLWSHRNLHRPGAPVLLPSPADACGGAARRNDGYTSDTLDAAAAREPKDKEVAVEEDPIIVLPNQWVALSSETTSSPLDRVSAWVNSLGTGSFHGVDEEEEDVTEQDDSGTVVRASCSEIVECSAATEKQMRARRRAAGEAVIQAGCVVQTLNAVASVAHISGMGLQGVPIRAVNLSGNFIVHIHPASLPKGLHSLDLSRNKITSIEGLRELTRLRVLNLSYNRISRIGHGLSSCTAIRELYLAGNKISDVEGLHRLLKLAVLDVSFNRVTTAKSLGQLVANYASLRALNLLGNPVQANVGDDTLRKAVAGLLPRLEYLNKQAVKPQRAREVAKDSVAQAALGNGGGWGPRSRRTMARRVGQSPGSSGKSRGRDGGGSHRRGSRSRSKTRAQGSNIVSRRFVR